MHLAIARQRLKVRQEVGKGLPQQAVALEQLADRHEPVLVLAQPLPVRLELLFRPFSGLLRHTTYRPMTCARVPHTRGAGPCVAMCGAAQPGSKPA